MVTTTDDSNPVHGVPPPRRRGVGHLCWKDDVTWIYTKTEKTHINADGCYKTSS